MNTVKCHCHIRVCPNWKRNNLLNFEIFIKIIFLPTGFEDLNRILILVGYEVDINGKSS